MRRAALFLILISFHSTDACADLVELTFDSETAIANLGTASETADGVSDTGGNPATIAFQVVGLTIDGAGSANDSIQLEFQLVGGGTAVGFGNAAGDWGVNAPAGTDASLIDAAGESITFNLTGATLALNGGTAGTNGITFLGFAGFDVTAFEAGDRFDLAGTSADGAGLASVPAFDPTTSFTVTYNDNGGSNDGFRIGNVVAQFSVVPEPGSLACVALLVAPMLLRRRSRVPSIT